MSLNCPKCHARKMLIDENTLACPNCDLIPGETPLACDYCHAHVASTPSDHGTWICDACIREAIAIETRIRVAQALKDASGVKADAN